MSTLVTYKNVSADSIRMGDRVEDARGNDFIAQSDAKYNENEQTYDVLAPGMRWISYDFMEGVTLTYDEADYPEYAA